MTKRGGKKSEPEPELAPGDWRRQPSDLAPPPPREPSARTIQLVHAYAGSQRVTLILGVIFLVVGLPLSLILSRAVGVGLFGYFFLLFPLVGLALTVTVVRENQREIHAHRMGVPAMATVVFRGLDMSTSVNDRHPFMIRWELEVAGQKYEGKLSHMEESLLADLGLNGQIVVLYDPTNPKVNTAYID